MTLCLLYVSDIMNYEVIYRNSSTFPCPNPLICKTDAFPQNLYQNLPFLVTCPNYTIIGYNLVIELNLTAEVEPKQPSICNVDVYGCEIEECKYFCKTLHDKPLEIQNLEKCSNFLITLSFKIIAPFRFS